MFKDILEMAFNYSDRKVARDNYDWGYISTYSVTDGAKIYETGIKHVDYKNGHIFIVDSYDTTEEALAGHIKWVEIMKDPPDSLIEICNSDISFMLGEERIYKRNENP